MEINQMTGEVEETLDDMNAIYRGVTNAERPRLVTHDSQLAELIEKANQEIECTPITRMDKKSGKTITKMYAEVWQRIKAFRKVYPKGYIEVKILNETEDSKVVRMEAKIYEYQGGLLLSSSVHEERKPSGQTYNINNIDILGNCETSAIGRALGFAGFMGNGGIATVEDMDKVEEFGNETPQATPKATSTKGATAKQIEKIKSMFDEGRLSNILFSLNVNSVDELSVKQASDIIGGKLNG